MKISELIRELEKIKEEHSDLKVDLKVNTEDDTRTVYTDSN